MTGSPVVDVTAESAAQPGQTSTSTTPKKEIVIRFNQNGSSLSVAAQDGFRVFDLSSAGELVMTYDFNFLPPISHIQRLYSTNLTAFVTATDPETLKIFNLRRHEVVCEHRYTKPINWLALNRLRVLVASDEKVFIHKLKNMDTVHTISEVKHNPRHLFTTATASNKSFLAFPCDSEAGLVSLYDLDSFKEKLQIPAHNTVLGCLSLNDQATHLATSSLKGTVIRVFDTSSGDKLHELRRGLKTANLYSLSFTCNGEYLCCTSDSETIHVFKVLTTDQRLKVLEEQGWVSSVGTLALQATGLFSSQAERYMQEERSVCTFLNPYHGLKTLCNIVAIPNKPDSLRLQLCGVNGFLNTFLLEKKEAEWVCQLHKAYFLTEVTAKQLQAPVMVAGDANERAYVSPRSVSKTRKLTAKDLF